MFRLTLVLVTVLPLIGMYRMEGGAWGADIAEAGYPNGATQSYLWHFLAFWVTFVVLVSWIPRRKARNKQAAKNPPTRVGNVQYYISFQRLAKTALAIQFFFCLFTFGPLGAYRVILFGMNRGELRASFGGLGALAFFQSQFLSPMLCALVASVFLTVGRRQDRYLLVGNCLLTAINIGMWGYRAAAAINLLPALIVLFPNVRISWSILRTAVLLVMSLLVSQTIFGASNADENAALQMWDRATTGTANSAWKIYDLHVAGHRFPPFENIFWSVLPNRLKDMLGVWRLNSYDSSFDSFTGITTTVVKDYDRDLDVRLSGVTVTTFCTGILSLGMPGYLVVSVLSGAIAAATQLWMDRARGKGDHVGLAFASTYAISSVWAYMNNGDPVVLFNVAAAIYYIAAAKCCRFLFVTQAVAVVKSKPDTLPALRRPIRRPNSNVLRVE